MVFIHYGTLSTWIQVESFPLVIYIASFIVSMRISIIFNAIITRNLVKHPLIFVFQYLDFFDSYACYCCVVNIFINMCCSISLRRAHIY